MRQIMEETMSDFVVEQEVPVQDRDPAVHSVQSSADIPSKKVGSRSRSQAAVVLGAILCAAVGFGIFWSLGIGSSSQGPFEKQFNPVAAWVSEQQPGLLEPHGAAASRVAEETPSTVNQHRNVSFESVVNPDGALPSRYSSESEFSSNASSTQFPDRRVSQEEPEVRDSFEAKSEERIPQTSKRFGNTPPRQLLSPATEDAPNHLDPDSTLVESSERSGSDFVDSENSEPESTEAPVSDEENLNESTSVDDAESDKEVFKSSQSPVKTPHRSTDLEDEMIGEASDENSLKDDAADEDSTNRPLEGVISTLPNPFRPGAAMLPQPEAPAIASESPSKVRIEASASEELEPGEKSVDMPAATASPSVGRPVSQPHSGFTESKVKTIPAHTKPASNIQPSPRASLGSAAFAAAPPLDGVLEAPSTSRPTATLGAFEKTASLPSGGKSNPNVDGTGRPGPALLEGIQAPQIAVEKRAPREVQVGKTARYEIIVRNVGTIAAHDVVLRDEVPQGSRLVSTTPPAAPGSKGEIVWSLGTLAQGAEARVSVEVVPQQEGEIGSVASVSFRADATMRSIATRPDLFIENTAIDAVLLGKDVKVSIRLSNPGTGVATGVVLEGMLPESLGHPAGRELEFDVGQLKPGESRRIDLVLATRSAGEAIAQIVARADGDLEVSKPLTIEVVAPSLELTAQMPARRYLQRQAVCVLSMANPGTSSAIGIEMVSQLPPGMKFIRANHAGYYDQKTHRVLWSLEELPAGEVGSVEMVLMPVDLGPQKIIAAARTSAGLADQIAHTVEVDGVAAINFEVSDSEDPIEVAGLTEYVVRVGNQGTKPASQVRIAATLVGDVEAVSAEGPVAHRVENRTVSFESLAKLSPAEEVIYRIRVRGMRAGDQRIQIQLTSDDHPTPVTKEEVTRVYADQ